MSEQRFFISGGALCLGRAQPQRAVCDTRHGRGDAQVSEAFLAINEGGADVQGEQEIGPFHLSSISTKRNS
jgi:hypothetical protein